MPTTSKPYPPAAGCCTSLLFPCLLQIYSSVSPTPKAQAPIVAPFSAGSPTPVAYTTSPPPAVYAPSQAQPPAAVAPFQTLFGGPSPVVAAYSPKVSCVTAYHSSCSAISMIL